MNYFYTFLLTYGLSAVAAPITTNCPPVAAITYTPNASWGNQGPPPQVTIGGLTYAIYKTGSLQLPGNNQFSNMGIPLFNMATSGGKSMSSYVKCEYTNVHAPTDATKSGSSSQNLVLITDLSRSCAPLAGSAYWNGTVCLTHQAMGLRDPVKCQFTCN